MRLVLAACLAAWLPASCMASGYEFEGVGARQVARGGAAVADSDDWTSIYWNPGSIVRAAQKNGREAGIEAFGGMSYGRDGDSLSSLVGPIFSKDKLSSHFLLGALGTVLPLGDRAAVGMGFYTPLLQGADFQDVSPLNGTRVDYEASATLLVSNLSASLALTPELSLGAGVNAIYGRLLTDVNLENATFIVPGVGAIPGLTIASHQDAHGMAAEGIFGVRYDPHPALSLGATYRTGADVPLRGDASASIAGMLQESSRFRFEMRHPPTLDLGFSVRPNSDWTFSHTFHQVYWHRFSNETVYDNPGALLSNKPNTYAWRDSWRLRFGVARRLGPKSDLLAGYVYDRCALDPGSVDFASTIDVTKHVISLGWARRWGRRFETTLAASTGDGTRTENGVRYRLSGYQFLAEARLGY